VGAVQVDALLQQRNHLFTIHVSTIQRQARANLIEVSLVLIVGDELGEVVHVDDDVDAAHLRLAELLRVHAREAHGLPRRDRVCLTMCIIISIPWNEHTNLASSVDGLSELLELDEHDGEPGVVADVVEEDLGGLEQLLREALLAAVEDLGHVRARDELLQIRQTIGLGEAVDQLVVNQRLLHLLTSHLQNHKNSSNFRQH